MAAASLSSFLLIALCAALAASVIESVVTSSPTAAAAVRSNGVDFPDRYVASVHLLAQNASGAVVSSGTYVFVVDISRNMSLMVADSSKTIANSTYVTALNFTEGRMYTFLNESNFFMYCNYAMLPSTINPYDTLFYPNTTSSNQTSDVTINGVLYHNSTGFNCIYPSVSSTESPVICSSYWLLVCAADNLPYQYVQNLPGSSQPMITLVYRNMSLNPGPSYFNMPARHMCSKSPGCSCPPIKATTIGDYKICQAGLAPSWVGAVIIGLVSAYYISRLGKTVTGSLCYSISFGTYAFMITSGFVVHCLYLVECGLASPTPGYFTWLKIDGGLTSCIAISFMFNGLVEIKVLKDRSVVTWLIMALTYILIFVLYDHGNEQRIYNLSITFGCGAYLIMMAVHIIRTKNFKGLGWIFAGALAGGLGFVVLRVFTCFICLHLGTGFLESGWYYASDVSMLCLARYVIVSRKPAAVESAKEKELMALESYVVSSLDPSQFRKL